MDRLEGYLLSSKKALENRLTHIVHVDASIIS